VSNQFNTLGEKYNLGQVSQDESLFEHEPTSRPFQAQETRTISPDTPITMTHPVDSPGTAREYAKSGYDKPVRLYEHEGNLHVWDGHHRVLGDRMAGRQTRAEIHR
jgi:hypothetical protein